MQLRWVKCPRGRAQHTANGHGNRGGIPVDRAGEQPRINHARWLHIDIGAINICHAGAGRICQRPYPMEKCCSGKRRHHE